MFGPCHEKENLTDKVRSVRECIGQCPIALTMLFKDVEETTYEDDCCHQRGNDLIAAKLAEAMTVPY